MFRHSERLWLHRGSDLLLYLLSERCTSSEHTAVHREGKRCMCVCVLRVCKGVRTPPNHQTSLFRAGQRPAVCFLLLYFTPWLFLPLLVLRGVSVLYGQTPTLSCSLPSSQTSLNIERERERVEKRKKWAVWTNGRPGQDVEVRCPLGVSDWPCYTYTLTQPAWEGKISLPHTQTHSSTPHPLLLFSILHPLSCPSLASSLWLHPALPRS